MFRVLLGYLHLACACAIASARPASLLIAALVATATPSVAQDPGAVLEWKSEAFQPSVAGTALGRFYATMFNAGQLATKEVTVQPGETPTDVMRREGSWPGFLGSSNQLVDALLCDLNRYTCSRIRDTARGLMLTDNSSNVAATVPSEGNWSGLQPGDLLRVPDYVPEARYETIVTSVDYISARYEKVARIESTGSFSRIYCNLNRSVCPDQPALTWDPADRPPVLQFDPGRYEAKGDDIQLPRQLLADFIGPKSRSVLLAVPILYLRQTILLRQKGNVAEQGLDDIQRTLPENVIVSMQLRTESGHGLQDFNHILLDRMTLDPPEIIGTPSTEVQPVTVYHFDKKAKLQHCLFQTLQGVQLFEWRFGIAGETGMPIELTPTAIDCTLVKGVASASQDHGTHTLGLLVSQLEAFAQRLPPSDVAYFNVVHVPLPGSFFGAGANQEDVASFNSVLSTMNLQWPRPDVVSMSISWPAGELLILDTKILETEELTTFVVAAPKQEALNACAQSPAGIRNGNGRFAQNVISVVGLKQNDATPEPTIGLLDGGGSGSICHEIGAFGDLLGPIGQTDQVGQLSGSSQATPLVAATVAELIRRLPDDRLTPESIAYRLVSTGWISPDPAMLNIAKATLLDARAALDTEDIIVTATGCRLLGEFRSIRNGDTGRTDNYIFGLFDPDGPPLQYVKGADLVSFRTFGESLVSVAYLDTEGIVVKVGRRQTAMERKLIRFETREMIGSEDTCAGIDPDEEDLSFAGVSQLIIRKFED